MNRVMSLLKEAGLPDGVVNLVNGNAESATLITEHPDIKALTFVGTSHVAELLSKKGRALNKRVLALGGAKNHLVAYPDCNTDMASQDIVVSSYTSPFYMFLNHASQNSFSGCSGQRCMAASVLLTVGKQNELVAKIIEKAKILTPGQSGSYAMGRM